MKYGIELLSILKRSNVSNALYDHIVEWLYQCDDMEAVTNLPKRQGLMKKLNNRYMMDGNYPQNKECILPSIGLPIYVPVHSFIHSIFSLLTATDLMTTENLLFHDKKDPSYVVPYNQTSKLGDINTGEAYYQYYDRVKHIPNSVIIPIMMFADGILIDKCGRLNQEPWMYTLAIFNSAVRNQPRAWRNLGLMKHNGTIGYKDEEIKESTQKLPRGPPINSNAYVPPTMVDWHKQVWIMFQQLLQVQQFLTGMNWRFVIDGKELKRTYNILLPVMVMMGDMPFLNKIVGLIGGQHQEHICRICNIKRDDLDAPYKNVTLTDTQSVHNAIHSSPITARNMGYYAFKDNVFHQLHFCHNYGVNQSTPVEPLHCVLLGLFIRLLQGLNRLRRHDMGANNLPDDDSEDTEVQAAHLIFTGKYKQIVTSDFLQIGFQLRQQCDTDIPRTYFPSGYLPNASDKDDNSTGKKWPMK